MLSSFLAEMDKLMRRPATWIFGMIWVIVSALLGYGLSYLMYKNPPPNTPSDVTDGMLGLVLPENVVGNVISGLPQLGGAIALIFGAIIIGSEFKWGTFKTIFIHQPKRLNVLGGKLLALVMILLVFVLAVFATGLLCSYFIATIEDVQMDWPPFMEFVKALLAGWFMVVILAMLGAMLATLFRGTTLAIGTGLVYIFVLEGMISGAAAQSEVIETIAKVLPGMNAGSLANTLIPSSIKDIAVGAIDIVDGTQAVFVLTVYAAGFLILTGLFIRQRDIIK